MTTAQRIPSHRRRPVLAVAASLVTLVASFAHLPGCSRGVEGSGSSKPRVVATTTMIGDLVRRIAGDHVDVRVIMGPGVDPHTYKPSPDDIAQIGSATLIVYNGLHLEGKMVELFEGKLKDRSFAVASAVPPARLIPWKDEGGGESSGKVHDPHIWFDVSLWREAIDPVRDRLIQLDAAHADDYRKRAAEFAAALDALHADVTAKINQIPQERRVLVTSHDAYGYFGKAYGIEVRGLQGISTETEAGLREVNEAVAFITQRKIPAIFVETSVNPKTIEQVQADCRARGWDVKVPEAELYSDAMGAPGERPGYAVETYEGVVRFNVDTIVGALK